MNDLQVELQQIKYNIEIVSVLIEMTFLLAGYDDGWVGYSAIAEAQIHHRTAIQIRHESGLTLAFECAVHVNAFRRCL